MKADSMTACEYTSVRTSRIASFCSFSSIFWRIVVLDFGERTSPRRLSLIDADQAVRIRRMDDRADFAGRHRVQQGGRLGVGHAVGLGPRLLSAGIRPRAVGVFLGDLAEVFAATQRIDDLLQNRERLRLSAVLGKADFQELPVDAFGIAVVGQVRFVIRQDFLTADDVRFLRFLPQIFVGEQTVTEFDLQARERSPRLFQLRNRPRPS